MYSVDLSAARYFRERDLPHRLMAFSGHRRVGILSYDVLTDPRAFEDHREVVFWGDFQQNPLWGFCNYAPRVARTEGKTLSEAVAEWRRRFLLEGVPIAEGQRFYSVGTCFLGARDFLERVGLDREGYRRLLSRFAAIVPRDDVSYRQIAELGVTNLLRGFDCASLLDHPARRPEASGHFAYAFGRSIPPRKGKAFVKRLAEALGLQAVRIAWFLGKYRLKNVARRYESAIETLRTAEFLVTDIYHLTINALNAGCPVYCVGREGESFSDTCDDFKKRVLMEMLGSEDDYFAFPEGELDLARFLSEAIVRRRPPGGTSGSRFRAIKGSFRETLARLWTVVG